MSFGEVIARRRKALGIAQKDLAALVSKGNGEPISPQYLNDLERDRRNPPGDHVLKQFARRLTLDEDYVFFVAGEWPEDLRDDSVAPETVRAALVVRVGGVRTGGVGRACSDCRGAPGVGPRSSGADDRGRPPAADHRAVLMSRELSGRRSAS